MTGLRRAVVSWSVVVVVAAVAVVVGCTCVCRMSVIPPSLPSLLFPFCSSA